MRVPAQDMHELLAQDPDWPMPRLANLIASAKWSRIAEGQMVRQLQDVLEVISNFVTVHKECVPDVIARLLVCGFLRVGNVALLYITALSQNLKLAHTCLRSYLDMTDWTSEDRETSMAKIVSGEYFPEYPGFFDSANMSPAMFRKLQFRIGPDVTPAEAIKETEEIEEVIQKVFDWNLPKHSLKEKLARVMKQNHAFAKRMKASDRRLAKLTIPEIIVDDGADSTEPESTGDPILDQIIQLARLPKCQRRYEEEMLKFGRVLDNISSQCYRALRGRIPFPAVSTLDKRFRDEKLAIRECLESPGCQGLPKVLTDYRTVWQITYEVPSTLVFDATSVSNTGIKTRKNLQYCFSYLLLPLRSDLPDLLVHSMAHPTGNISTEVLEVAEVLTRILSDMGFSPHFLATDGDKGSSEFHTAAFQRYGAFGDNITLLEVVGFLTQNGTVQLHCWPISDFLHLLKNARSRIARGRLALGAETAETITAQSLNGLLNLGRDLAGHSALELLQDDLALRVFTLGNLLVLAKGGQYTGVYFFMPLVALNLAIRNELISKETRLQLIQVAFSIFFRMKKSFPDTGKKFGIGNNVVQNVNRQTLWSREMCTRGCNLCVGLYWAIITFPNCLPLGRIGTHSVECLFGTTRSMLRGDTSWGHFLGTEVDAIMTQNMCKELDIQPYIRRFKKASGCTVMDDTEKLITVLFDDETHTISDKVARLATFLEREADSLIVYDGCDGILAGFMDLAVKLQLEGYEEVIVRPSPMSGGGITTRFFVGSRPEQGAKDEEIPVMAIEADIEETDFSYTLY
jgi:hypothetical protein